MIQLYICISASQLEKYNLKETQDLIILNIQYSHQFSRGKAKTTVNLMKINDVDFFFDRIMTIIRFSHETNVQSSILLVIGFIILQKPMQYLV